MPEELIAITFCGMHKSFCGTSHRSLRPTTHTIKGSELKQPNVSLFANIL
jgi:hypothetical protein